MRKRNRFPGSAVYLRRSPFVVSYWQNGELVFENYLTRRKVAASAETAAMLDFFSSWKPMQEIVFRWREYSPESLLKGVLRLVRETLLDASRTKNPPEGERERALRKWRAWNPAAGFFHLSTKDIYAKEVTPEEIAFVEHLAKNSPVPKPVKAYPRARAIKLPSGTPAGEFPRVLLARRTWREFSERKISLQSLATLLNLTFAIQKWEKVPGMGLLAQKTSPSGGSLHPAEAYVLVRKVEGVPKGIYHYDANGRQLKRLRAGMTAAEIQRDLAGQWWFRDAAVVVFLTAVFRRTQWKYDYARAYRAVLIEAGHLCQTFCLTATWLGLAPFCTIAVADTAIEKSLGIDGISESVTYAMGVGHKPQKT